MQLTDLFLAIVCLGSSCGLVSADNNTTIVESFSVPELPTCSLPCFHVALRDIKCPHGNTTCACGNLDMQISIQACSRSLCSIYDSLETHKYLDNVCGQPDRDQGTLIRVLCWLGLFLTTISLAVRVLCKIFGSSLSGSRTRPTLSSLTPDDWALIVTHLTAIPVYVIVGYVLVDAGLGRDVWTLESNRIDSIGYWLYIFEPLYILIMTLLKTSFLLFFLQIFCRGQSERMCLRGLLNMRLTLWGTMAFNAACGLCFILPLLLQCQPISYTWTRWPGDGEHDDGTCINTKAVIWANGVLSVVLNAWILYLPFSQLHGMNLTRHKQIIIGVMFGLGAFVSVVSVLRLQGLISYGDTVVDPTWDYYPSVVWSVLEFTVGILCACLSAARGVLLRSTSHGSRLFSDNVGSSSNTRSSKQLGHLSRISFHNWRKSNHQSASTEAQGICDQGYQSGSSRLAFASESVGMEQFPELTDIESRPVLLRRDSSYRDMTEPAPVSEALKDIIRETTRTSLELSPMREEFIEALGAEDSIAPNADTCPTVRKGTNNATAAGGRRASGSTKKRRITPDFFLVPALTGGVGSSWRASIALNNTIRGRAMSSPRSPPRVLFQISDWSQPNSSVTELASPNQTKRERNGSVASIQKPN